MVAPEFLQVRAGISGPEGLPLPPAVRAWRGTQCEAGLTVAAICSWLTSSAGGLSAASWDSGASQIMVKYLYQQIIDECRPSLALILFEKSVL